MENSDALEMNRVGHNIHVVSNEPSKCNIEGSELGAQPRRWTRHWRTLMAAFITALGSCALGTVMSYPAVAIPDINSREHHFHLNNLEVALVVSTSSLGGLVGGTLGGIFLDRFGRKTTMIFTTLPFVVGWLLIVASPNVYCLCSGRLLTGLSAGVMDVSVPVYTTEIAAASVRGFMGSCAELFVNIGFLYTYTFGTFLSWKWLAEVCLFVPALMAAGLLFVPESPRWLFKVGRKEECKDVLLWLRGQDDIVNQEMSEMAENEKTTEASKASWGEFLKPNVYRPLFIIVGLMFFQQMGGCSVITQYMVSILEAAGSKWDPNSETAVVGALGVLANLLSAFIVDRVGRRTMLLISATIVTLSLAGSAIYFTILELNLSENVSQYSIVVFICIAMYNTAFSLGYGPVPFYLASELLPLSVRGKASGLAISSVWMFLYTGGISFPYVVSALGFYGVFWLMTGFALLAIVFAYIMVPETAGLSLETIEQNNCRSAPPE